MKTGTLLLSFLMLLVGFTLNSCAFKKSDTVNAQDQQFEDANNKLKAEYSQAEGLYRGEIQRSGKQKPIQVDVRLIVLSDEKGSGKTSSGKDRQMVKLVGVLTQTETNKESTEMSATFDGASGHFTLSSANSYIAYLEGNLINGQLNADVKTREGTIGKLIANRISIIPDLETLDEQAARFNRFYDRIVGVYDSTMILQFTTGPRETPISFAISPGTLAKPGLASTCNSDIFGPAPMNTIYLPEEAPPYISLSAINVGSSSTVCPYDKLEGRITGNKVTADITSKLGDVQQVIFTKRK